jgi:hypothetical protein
MAATGQQGAYLRLPVYFVRESKDISMSKIFHLSPKIETAFSEMRCFEFFFADSVGRMPVTDRHANDVADSHRAFELKNTAKKSSIWRLLRQPTLLSSFDMLSRAHNNRVMVQQREDHLSGSPAKGISERKL